MDKQARIEELMAEIATLESQQACLERWKENVRSLDSFSDDEKIKAFDKIYKSAESYIEDAVLNGTRPKDGKYYIFEEVMNLTLGEKVWGILRLI